LFTTEHLRPLGKVQVNGHDKRLALVTLGHHLEEELGSLLRKWHIADLIDDQQVHLGEITFQKREPETGLARFIHEVMRRPFTRAFFEVEKATSGLREGGKILEMLFPGNSPA
jgi:hypothetical protein